MGLFKKKEPQMLIVRGKQLTCPICSGQYFHGRNVLLNTTFASFFNFDWANQSAKCFVCSDCTYIFWFLR